MKCEYCKQSNCKKHTKCICKYCKYTCFTKETFKKHNCPVIVHLEEAEQRYKNTVQQIYLDARQEIESLTKVNEEYLCIHNELESRIRELNQINHEQQNQLEKTKLVHSNDKKIYEKYIHEITTKDLEIVNLKQKLEKNIFEYNQKLLEYSKNTTTKVSHIKNETDIQINIITNEYEEKINTLKNQIENFENDRYNEISNLHKTIELKLQQQKEKYEKELYDCKNNCDNTIRDFSCKYNDLKNKYDTQDIEYKSIQHKLSTLQNSLIEYKQNSDNEYKKNETIWSERYLDISSKYDKLCIELQNKESIFENEIKESTCKISELSSMIETLSTQNTQLHTVKTDMTQKYEYINELYNTLNIDYDNLKMEYDKYVSLYIKVNQEYKDAQSKYQNTIETLSKSLYDEKQQNILLKQDIQHIQTKIVDTQYLETIARDKESRVIELENMIQSMKSENSIKNNEISYLTDTLHELSNSKKQLQQELNISHVKYDEIHTKLMHSDKELFSIRQKIEEYKTRTEKNITNLTEEIKEKNSYIEHTNNKINILETNNQELFLTKRDLENSREEKIKEIKHLNDQIEKQQQTIETLVERVNSCEEQNREIKRLRETNHSYRLRINEIRTEHAEREIKMQKLIDSYKRELEQIQYEQNLKNMEYIPI